MLECLEGHIAEKNPIAIEDQAFEVGRRSRVDAASSGNECTPRHREIRIATRSGQSVYSASVKTKLADVHKSGVGMNKDAIAKKKAEFGVRVEGELEEYRDPEMGCRQLNRSPPSTDLSQEKTRRCFLWAGTNPAIRWKTALKNLGMQLKWSAACQSFIVVARKGNVTMT
ncbi:hypothetical protein K438DRAFT_1937520 [Mycena galopus ATCC 62051]|nr:hypothetical protein K438DRAFT_1937520 [Mycena galopus ATCC 62051]